MRTRFLSGKPLTAIGCLALFAFFAHFVPLQAQGSGWTQGLGGVFLKAEQRILVAEDFYDSSGNIISIPSSAVLTTSVYGEVGILNRLDVIAYVPLYVIHKQRKTTDTGIGGSNNSLGGLGDMNIGLKLGLIRDKPIVLSVGFQFGIPTGRSSRNDPIPQLQTGDGEFNQTLYADLGVSLWPAPVYLAAGASFNNRNNSFADEVNWYLAGGIEFFKIVSAKVQVIGLYSLKNGSIKGKNPPQVYSIFLNNVNYLAYGGELGITFLPTLTANLGVDFAGSGQNILAGPTLFVGLAFEL